MAKILCYWIPSYIVIRGGEREGRAWFLVESRCGGWSGWGEVLPAVLVSSQVLVNMFACGQRLTCLAAETFLTILQLWGWS